jgi:hypothetical protein
MLRSLTGAALLAPAFTSALVLTEKKNIHHELDTIRKMMQKGMSHGKQLKKSPMVEDDIDTDALLKNARNMQANMSAPNKIVEGNRNERSRAAKFFRDNGMASFAKKFSLGDKAVLNTKADNSGEE